MTVTGINTGIEKSVVAEPLGVHVQQCSSTAEFLEILRPSHSIWSMDRLERGAWGFRGQADADWGLIPSALRCGTQVDSPNTPFVSDGDPECVEQLNAEYRAIRRFVDLADEVGLPIPGDLQLLWQDGLGADPIGSTIGTAQWPLPGLLETLAVAQHHGVPTRLLDFTFDPLVAAYFAASDSARLPEDGLLAVWAINMTLIRKTFSSRHDLIREVRVPRAANTYLRAQKGFFVLNQLRSQEPLEEAVQRAVLRRYDCKTDAPPVIRIEAPCGLAHEILHLLSLESVDQVHLMPSFATVVQKLRPPDPA